MKSSVFIEDKDNRFDITIAPRREHETVIIEVSVKSGALDETKCSDYLRALNGVMAVKYQALRGDIYFVFFIRVDYLNFNNFLHQNIDNIADVVSASTTEVTYG